MRALPLIFAASTLAPPAGAQAANQRTLRQEIEALMSAMIAAHKADPASVASFYTDDAIMLGGNDRAIGRQQVANYWRRQTGAAEWTLDVLEVAEGDMPWMRGRSTIRLTNGRMNVSEFVGIFKRQDGKLKFYVDMYVLASATLPPGALGMDSVPTLAGLWEAKRRFGPDLRGRLVLDRAGAEWRATIAGHSSAVQVVADSLSVHFPNGAGAFRGRFDARQSRIVGQWIQPRTVTFGARFATPVALEPCGPQCYEGEVVPLDDEYTFYLKVSERPDGKSGAFLRNPQRNLGRFVRIARADRQGRTVRFLDARDSLVATGIIRNDVISVNLYFRGGTYDFRRVPDTSFSNFYPRGRPTASYTYAPPRAKDDGWPVGTLQDVGMSVDTIAALMRRVINNSVDSLGVLELHALLVARHGKLVLEEYFHGEHAEKAHDTRSAGKTLASTLIGAAMHARVNISPETRVYSVMRPQETNIDARKRALKLDHLLTMSSGLDCDDGGEARPGNENTLTNGENPDWVRAILDLGMIRDPGEKAVYCSINPHLAGAVLSKVAQRPLPELMWNLLGEPLGMRRYYLNLAPLGDVYMGGGARLRARDFAKLAQLYLNGGTWHGKRVFSQDWAQRATASRYSIFQGTNYGYLWWSLEYPYKGRRVRAFYAAGNGGQYTMAIPELDLVIAGFGANYNEAAGRVLTDQLIPRYVLPAILDPGTK